MLYAFARPFARLGLKYYFRRIDLAHLERIPKGVPVILAANHPTTFIEPCILACFQDNPLYFLARGDFFRSPFFARLLKGVHIVPIYRLHDAGFGGIKQNYESFEKSYQILAENRTLMILAEGRCIHEKRLRPIRKGTARIALGALTEKQLPEVYIVPIGANFTYADRLRSQVMLSCGKPMRASAYLDAYRRSEAGAIKQFTDDLRDRLRQEVIVVEDMADEPLVEYVHQLYRTEHYDEISKNGIHYERQQLRAEQRIADTINGLDPNTKERWNLLAHDYFSRLQQMRVTDEAFAGCYHSDATRSALVLLLALPVMLLLILHLPILLLVQWISGTKIKSIEFAGPVRWAASVFLYLVCSLVCLLVSLLTGAYQVFVLWLLAVISIPGIINYLETAWRWLLAWRVRRQPVHLLDYLSTQRQALLRMVSTAWLDPSVSKLNTPN